MRISTFTRFQYNTFLAVDIIYRKVFISVVLAMVTNVYPHDKTGIGTILLFLNQTSLSVSHTRR